MQPFTTLTALAASLPAADVDTDIIFPARFLLHTQKAGLGQYAFYDWRYHADGRENRAFALNRPEFVGAQILVAGPNFGCGSSREQAPWAMVDLGIRCVIAESFGEIFFANCFRNGMLPIAAPEAVIAELADLAEAGCPITVDLNAQQVLADGRVIHEIGVDPARRQALLNGWNETAVILNTEGKALDQFDARMREAMPWLFGDALLETTHG